MLVLVGGVVGGIARGPAVALVGAGELRAVRRAVAERPLRDAVGRHDQVRGHRQVAEDPLALGQLVVRRARDIGEAPHGDAALPLGRGEEVPVAHRLAEGRVGDVVGCQAELVDGQQHLPRLELALGHRRRRELDRAQVVARDEEVEGSVGCELGHRCPMVTSRRQSGDKVRHGAVKIASRRAWAGPLRV